MDHSSIKYAFENASGIQKTDNPIIYMVFQRLTLCLKDIYYILVGNAEQVKKAIEKCDEQTKKNRKEDWDTDEIKVLDTPFDTYCGGHCKIIGLNKCKLENKNKCCGDWIQHELKSQNEIDEFIKTIPSKVDHPHGRFEIWDMTENGLILHLTATAM